MVLYSNSLLNIEVTEQEFTLKIERGVTNEAYEQSNVEKPVYETCKEIPRKRLKSYKIRT